MDRKSKERQKKTKRLFNFPNGSKFRTHSTFAHWLCLSHSLSLHFFSYIRRFVFSSRLRRWLWIDLHLFGSTQYVCVLWVRHSLARIHSGIDYMALILKLNGFLFPFRFDIRYIMAKKVFLFCPKSEKWYFFILFSFCRLIKPKAKISIFSECMCMRCAFDCVLYFYCFAFSGHYLTGEKAINRNPMK